MKEFMSVNCKLSKLSEADEVMNSYCHISKQAQFPTTY